MLKGVIKKAMEMLYGGRDPELCLRAINDFMLLMDEVDNKTLQEEYLFILADNDSLEQLPPM